MATTAFSIDPDGRIAGEDQRDEVRNAVFTPVATPRHDAPSTNYIVFVPNIMGCRLKDDKGKEVRLQPNNVWRYYEAFGEDQRIPDQFVVIVGVMEGEKLHDAVNPDDSPLTYDALFEILKYYGYDPLHPLRDKTFQRLWENRLGNELVKMINRNRVYTASEIRQNLKKIGRIIRDICRDYIHGGDKPPLAQKTIYNRTWKQEEYPKAKYPGYREIEEPLSETGQLEHAIQVYVESYKSETRKFYFEEKKKEARRLEAIRRANRLKKEKERREAREKREKERRTERLAAKKARAQEAKERRERNARQKAQREKERRERRELESRNSTEEAVRKSIAELEWSISEATRRLNEGIIWKDEEITGARRMISFKKNQLKAQRSKLEGILRRSGRQEKSTSTKNVVDSIVKKVVRAKTPSAPKSTKTNTSSTKFEPSIESAIRQFSMIQRNMQAGNVFDIEAAAIQAEKCKNILIRKFGPKWRDFVEGRGRTE